MSIINTIRTSAVPARLVASWNVFSTKLNPIVLIIVMWTLLSVPLVFFRSYNSDEGLAVTIARSALEDGYWITPHVFNERLVERPTLLSWIIAAVSLPFGTVSQFTARLPIALFLLSGCLLIFGLLRKLAVSSPAAVLGSTLFLTCPLVQRAYVMPTADMPLAVLLFFAFFLWWIGYSAGSISIHRWIMIGIVLAFAGLMKGPQPVSYFAVGIGLFIIWTRSWRQIPGLVLAGILCVIPLVGWYAYVYVPGDEAEWASFMRFTPTALLPGPIKATWHLFTETLPATLLAGAFFLSIGFRGNSRVQPTFIKAIACYAFIMTPIILFWPGGSAPRYYFPMVLPLCVLGALAYDDLGEHRPQFLAPGLSVMLGILAYAFVYSVVASPLLPRQFRSAQIDAARIAELVRASPAPIYKVPGVGLNVFPYIPGRIIGTDIRTLESIAGPAWIAVPPDQADTLIQKRSGALRVVISFGKDNEWRLLRLEN